MSKLRLKWLRAHGDGRWPLMLSGHNGIAVVHVYAGSVVRTQTNPNTYKAHSLSGAKKPFTDLRRAKRWLRCAVAAELKGVVEAERKRDSREFVRWVKRGAAKSRAA